MALTPTLALDKNAACFVSVVNSWNDRGGTIYLEASTEEVHGAWGHIKDNPDTPVDAELLTLLLLFMR